MNRFLTPLSRPKPAHAREPLHSLEEIAERLETTVPVLRGHMASRRELAPEWIFKSIAASHSGARVGLYRFSDFRRWVSLHNLEFTTCKNSNSSS